MIDPLTYHAISESTHRILNPLSESKLDVLGEIAGLGPASSMLDLASGKGEMLCRFAARHGISGVGVDVYEPFAIEARARAAELGVSDRLEFVVGEAAAYSATAARFDVACCIGATWIGGGFAGTLRLLAPLLRPGGVLLIGECFTVPAGWDGEPDEFMDLPGMLDAVEATSCELVEMVLADHDDWDRYATSQWLNVARWLDSHPDDPRGADVRAERDRSRRTYLTTDRDHLGWGVFALRPAA